MWRGKGSRSGPSRKRKALPWLDGYFVDPVDSSIDAWIGQVTGLFLFVVVSNISLYKRSIKLCESVEKHSDI